MVAVEEMVAGLKPRQKHRSLRVMRVCDRPPSPLSQPFFLSCIISGVIVGVGVSPRFVLWSDKNCRAWHFLVAVFGLAFAIIFLF